MGVAFRPPEEAYITPMPLLPRHLTLENLIDVLERFTRATSVVTLYRNSIIIGGVTVGLVVLATACSGFAFSRLRFPGRDIFFWVVTIWHVYAAEHGTAGPLSDALPV